MSMPMAMNWAKASPLAQVRIASAVRSSVKSMRSSGAVRPRMRSFFNLSFLSGGERVPLTFVGHPLGTDKQITVQAKVVLPANKPDDVHVRYLRNRSALPCTRCYCSFQSSRLGTRCCKWRASTTSRSKERARANLPVPPGVASVPLPMLCLHDADVPNLLG